MEHGQQEQQSSDYGLQSEGCERRPTAAGALRPRSFQHAVGEHSLLQYSLRHHDVLQREELLLLWTPHWLGTERIPQKKKAALSRGLLELFGHLRCPNELT
jgi:hypothetical protein